MITRNRCIVALFCLLVLSSVAQADVIIDTGGIQDPLAAGLLDIAFHRAGMITLDQEWTVTEIEVWARALTAGNLTFAIYDYAAAGPLPANLLFSTTFAVAAPDSEQFVWMGPDGLDWDLGPGSFWVALRPTSADMLTAYPVDPLDEYMRTGPPYGAWTDGWAFGLRMQGEPQREVVPEPATLTLLGLGLVGCAVCRRRRV